MRRAAAIGTFLVMLAAGVPSASAGSAADPPGRATTGYGSSEAYISPPAAEQSTGSAIAGTKVWWYVPQTLRDGDTAPVVVFLHGFALLAPDIYAGHIEHLTRQGVIVVYPQYNLAAPGLLFDTNQNTMQQRAIDATNEALSRIGAAAGDLHLYGHSLGGKIAATWQAAGGPTPSSVTLANASTGNGGPFGGTGIDWQAKAPLTTAPVILLTGVDDDIAPPSESVDLYGALTAAPTRVLFQATSDAHGSPGLAADHMAPIQDDGVIPSFMADFLGGDATDDALDHRFYQAALDAALDAQPSLDVDMGTWSDGIPVSSPTVLAADLPPVVVVPDAPASVNATAGDAQVDVTWTAPASDGGSPVTAYDVLRDGNVIATTDAATTAFTDTGVVNGTTYAYTVAATNGAGTGPPAGPASATPTAPDPPPVPAATLAVTATPDTVASGQAIEYSIAITNNGEVTLTDLTIESDVAPECDRVAGDLEPMTPGADTELSCTLTPTTADQLGSLVNTVTLDAAELSEPVTTSDDGVDVTIPAHAFGDVPPWVAEAVSWLSWDPDADGPLVPLATGWDDEFRPQLAPTRAQLVRMLYRLAGSPSPTGDHPFTDVAPWVETAVDWAFATDVITGYGDEFRPGLAPTRAQLIRMLHRLAGSPTPTGDHPFTDVPPWVEDAVDWAFTTGVVRGWGDEFRPDVAPTRAQLASILYGFNLTQRLVDYPATA